MTRMQTYLSPPKRKIFDSADGIVNLIELWLQMEKRIGKRGRRAVDQQDVTYLLLRRAGRCCCCCQNSLSLDSELSSNPLNQLVVLLLVDDDIPSSGLISVLYSVLELTFFSPK